MNNVREDIINKIIETIKDKVYESFNNQAQRLIDIQAKYYAWDELRCDTHNDWKTPQDIKQQKLEELKKIDPRLGLGVMELNYLRDNKERIKQIYIKKAEKFLENVGNYVEERLKGDIILKIEQLHFNFNNGSWKINDNKIFSFKTILAGGYNIQCLHIRVIYSYKQEIK